MSGAAQCTCIIHSLYINFSKATTTTIATINLISLNLPSPQELLQQSEHILRLLVLEAQSHDPPAIHCESQGQRTWFDLKS